VRLAPVATLPIRGLNASISVSALGIGSGGLPLGLVPGRGQIEKIAQNVVAVLGDNAFGMELHAMHRQMPVRQAHHEPVFGRGGDFELGRHSALRDDQRMIARRLQRCLDAGENAFAAMVNGRELAVHRQSGAHDLAAKGLADRLVAEADAENRNPRAGRLDEVEASPASLGVQGPGESTMAVGKRGDDLFDRDLSLRWTDTAAPRDPR